MLSNSTFLVTDLLAQTSGDRLVEWLQGLHPAIVAPAYALAVVGVIMGLCLYGSLAERKVSAWIQGRPGPNRVAIPFIAAIPLIGPFLQRLGIFQPLADGGKFLLKEEPLPGHVKKFYFNLAPVVALVPALTTIVVVPFAEYVDAANRVIPVMLANLDVGILLIFAISSLGVYSSILAGWASNSKYPFLAGVRASSQMISYEIAMSLAIIPLFLFTNGPQVGGGTSSGTLSLVDIVHWQAGSIGDGHTWFILVAPLSALLFLVALFAETNRLPFDMVEGESELVGGFHTEYGAFKFGLLMTAEYAHMFVGSAIFSTLFLGGWNPLPSLSWTELGVIGLPGVVLGIGTLLFKVCAMAFFFMWVRWTLPRFRYDQVMRIGWRILLPLAVANLIFYMFVIAAVTPKVGG